jgi:hypothetical protein
MRGLSVAGRLPTAPLSLLPVALGLDAPSTVLLPRYPEQTFGAHAAVALSDPLGGHFFTRIAQRAGRSARSEPIASNTRLCSCGAHPSGRPAVSWLDEGEQRQRDATTQHSDSEGGKGLCSTRDAVRSSVK